MSSSSFRPILIYEYDSSAVKLFMAVPRDIVHGQTFLSNIESDPLLAF